jgi:leucyl aminopeptidase
VNGMQIEFKQTQYAEFQCDVLAVPLFEEEKGESQITESLDSATRSVFRSVLASGELKTELHSTCLIHHPRGLRARRLLMIGAGRRSELTLARLRDLAGTVARRARSAGGGRLAFEDRSGLPAEGAARVLVEGALYGEYEPDAYKTRDREERRVDRFVILREEGGSERDAAEGIRKGRLIGEAVNLARTLANEPANVLTPSHFAERAGAAGKECGLEVEILERDEMEKMGMNTLLAVARGSEEPPKLIILRIPGQARRKGPLHALIGKGVTFDSGGISIKPAEKMEDMKADMAGGAAVLGAMVALAGLRPRRRVIGIIPAVENLPSGRATRPGDVVKSLLGKTVEIINTDAEGRLILADAIAYARKLGATSVIDIATLTGACVVALGNINAGVMGTDQKTIDQLRRNASITGEKVWQLPIDDEYKKLLKSEIADMKNVGNRSGGAITAAKFLQEFVEETPWVHLDIAGVDLDHDGRPFAAKGATGFGVRTLAQLFL